MCIRDRRLAAQTERFRDLRLFGYTHEYDEQSAKQFDALSFLVPDGTLFVEMCIRDRWIVRTVLRTLVPTLRTAAKSWVPSNIRAARSIKSSSNFLG